MPVERGSVERAVSAYARVLKLGANATKPDAPRAADAADAHVLLAARLLAGGTRRHVKAAAAHLRRAVARAPGLAAAHALLADAYRDLARPGPAAPHRAAGPSLAEATILSVAGPTARRLGCRINGTLSWWVSLAPVSRDRQRSKRAVAETARARCLVTLYTSSLRLAALALLLHLCHFGAI